MKPSHVAKIFLASTLAIAMHANAARAEVGVHVGVGIGLPPPIVFPVVPQLVVLPGTYVYAVPEVTAEIYFVDGWWWRPYGGHWYRSHYYDRDWVSYSSVPYFYGSIPGDWRTSYSRNEWGGRPWNYQRVSYDDARQNWSSWKKEKRWERTAEGRSVTTQDSRPVSREYRGNAGAKGNAAVKNQSQYKASKHASPASSLKKASPASSKSKSVRGPSHSSKAPAKSQQKMKGASHSKGGKPQAKGQAQGGNEKQGHSSGGGGGGGHGKGHK